MFINCIGCNVCLWFCCISTQYKTAKASFGMFLNADKIYYFLIGEIKYCREIFLFLPHHIYVQYISWVMLVNIISRRR